MAIEIFVNGEAQSAPEGVTVLQLLKKLQIDPERVAVELDRKIVKAQLWPDTILRQGSQLEIVQFVGGG
jgi:thiamine biosynthesis protein ThiS